MRATTGTILLLCTVMSATLPARSESADRRAAALWVWGRQGPEVVDLARARGFDRLYLEVPPGEAAGAAVREIVSAAATAGIDVWAMNGRPSWAFERRSVSRWAREVRSAGGFAGAVLDIEPYTLPEWKHDATRSWLTRRYLQTLRRARSALGRPPLVAAIPFWFDHDAYRLQGMTLAEAVLRRTDGVVVMAYRDVAAGPDGIIQSAAGEVALATGLGKTAIVGVQTAADALDKLTFFEEGRRALQRETALVAQALGAQAGFGGLAVHHYTAYRVLGR